ncbi:MAG: hypothetical protein ACR65X_16095 [Methylocystis sp.]
MSNVSDFVGKVKGLFGVGVGVDRRQRNEHGRRYGRRRWRRLHGCG